MIHNPGLIEVTLDIDDVILTCSSNILEVVPVSVNISPDCPSATPFIELIQVHDVQNSSIISEPNFVAVSSNRIIGFTVQITDLAVTHPGTYVVSYKVH